MAPIGYSRIPNFKRLTILKYANYIIVFSDIFDAHLSSSSVNYKFITLEKLKFMWCSGYRCCITSFSKASTQILPWFNSYSWCVECICDGKNLTMVPAGNKAERLSSVNHSTKTIHHHQHHHYNT